MNRFSLMYENAPPVSLRNTMTVEEDKVSDNINENSYDFKNILGDLNIFNLVNVVNMSENELKTVFEKLIDFNTTKEDISLRHGIINDFLGNSALLPKFEELMQLFLKTRTDMMDAKKLSYRNNDSTNDTVNYTKMANACYYLNVTYKLIYSFYNNIQQLDLKSSKLNKIIDFIEDLLKKSPLKILSDNCTNFIEGINEGVLYDVSIKLNSILRVISINIYDFRFPRQDATGLFNFMMKKLSMEQRKYRDKLCYRDKNFEHTNDLNLRDDIYLKGIFNSQLNMIARRIVNVYETLMDTFKNISDELIFYKFAVSLIQYYRNQGIEYCYSTLNDKTDYENTKEIENERRPKIYFKNLFDFSLLYHSEQPTIEVVGNDFSLEDENTTNIIIGNNQSGKTTFIRSVGLALIFARSGIPVPAQEANVFLFSRLYTHFERFDADVKNEGQLDLELDEMSKIVYTADEKSIVIMNESFATTGVKDAVSISGDILSILAHIGTTVLFVTHLPQLAESLAVNEKLKNREHLRLFKTGADNKGNPTYKVEEQTYYSQKDV